jgi:hypothetical protein
MAFSDHFAGKLVGPYLGASNRVLAIKLGVCE